jgi:hypothetical protein
MDALTAAVNWEKNARKAVVAEDLDFSAKKKSMAQLSRKGARMLSGPLYAKFNVAMLFMTLLLLRRQPQRQQSQDGHCAPRTAYKVEIN